VRFAFQTIVNGLALGGIYAIIALGFAVVYSVLRMMNFAHGDTYMVGVFVMLSLILAGVPVVAALAMAMVLAGLLAMAVERFGYRPMRDSHPMMGIIAAVAVALVLQQIVVLVWGVGTRPFRQAFPHNLSMGGVLISETQIVTLAVTLVIAVGTTILLKRTRWGRAILLVRQDMEVARLMGIPVNRVISIVYFFAGALGAVGGYLFVSTYGVIDPTFGFQQTIEAFIAAVLGGIGGLGGAVLGGLALGLCEQAAASYISSSYQTAVAFGILVVFLLIRPHGLLGSPVLKGQRA
jgi:branched-chain amino acid transport system permease protein